MSLHTLGWYVSVILFVLLSIFYVRYSRLKRWTLRELAPMRAALRAAQDELRSAR